MTKTVVTEETKKGKRKRVKHSISELFPEIGDYDGMEITGWDRSNAQVPDIDDGYYFPPQTLDLLMALFTSDKCLIVGHTGSGKSSLVQQVAARLNWMLYRVNFDGEMSRSSLLGEWVVMGNGQADKVSMRYLYGIVPTAIKKPAILLLDEWDMMNPSVSGAIQRLLEENGKLLLTDAPDGKGGLGEEVTPHKKCRIICTSNTVGRGDVTGLYGNGTFGQSFAQLDRFKTVIRLDYMPEEKEVELLLKKFKGKLKKPEAQAFARVAGLVRSSFVKGDLEATMSPRTLMSWIEKYLWTKDEGYSLEIAFLNKLTEEDAEATKQITKRVFKGQE